MRDGEPNVTFVGEYSFTFSSRSNPYQTGKYSTKYYQWSTRLLHLLTRSALALSNPMLGGARSPNPDRSSDANHANQRRIARPYYRPAASPAIGTHSAVNRENGKASSPGPTQIRGPHVMLTQRNSRGERSGCCHPLPRCMHLPLPFLLPPHAIFINRGCRAAPPLYVKHLTCTPTGGGVPILSTHPMRPLRRIHLLLLLLLLLVSSLRFAAFQVTAQIFSSVA